MRKASCLKCVSMRKRPFNILCQTGIFLFWGRGMWDMEAWFIFKKQLSECDMFLYFCALMCFPSSYLLRAIAEKIKYYCCRAYVMAEGQKKLHFAFCSVSTAATKPRVFFCLCWEVKKIQLMKLVFSSISSCPSNEIILAAWQVPTCPFEFHRSHGEDPYGELHNKLGCCISSLMLCAILKSCHQVWQVKLTFIYFSHLQTLCRLYVLVVLCFQTQRRACDTDGLFISLLSAGLKDL